MTADTLETAGEMTIVRGDSSWRQAWRRLAQRPAALIGLAAAKRRGIENALSQLAKTVIAIKRDFVDDDKIAIAFPQRVFREIGSNRFSDLRRGTPAAMDVFLVL